MLSGENQGQVLDDDSRLQASLATLRGDNERLSGIAGISGEKDARISALAKELEDKASMSNEASAKIDLLNQQLLALRRQIAALNEALQSAEAKDKESQARISDLGARLNVVLARQVQELQRYRSDFFGRLRELLRDRKDIRVVGDRFVFQSEVLFPSGQATMTVEGLAAIDQLAQAIVELERSIPKEIDWALQVDGHTDIRPIASSQFPSNWELSSARSTSVVKYLISRGVPPRNGGGPVWRVQPLEDGASEESLRRTAARVKLRTVDGGGSGEWQTAGARDSEMRKLSWYSRASPDGRIALNRVASQSPPKTCSEAHYE